MKPVAFPPARMHFELNNCSDNSLFDDTHVIEAQIEFSYKTKKVFDPVESHANVRAIAPAANCFQRKTLPGETINNRMHYSPPSRRFSNFRYHRIRNLPCVCVHGTRGIKSADRVAFELLISTHRCCIVYGDDGISMREAAGPSQARATAD